MKLPVQAQAEHGVESPWEGAPPWAIEIAWMVYFLDQKMDVVLANTNWLKAELEGKHKAQITATGDVVTTQPSPTAPGPT